MIQSNTRRGVWVVAVVATTMVAAIAPAAAAQQGSAAAAKPAAAPTADSAKPVKKSRFGRFGRAFDKAVTTASNVGAKAGISKETAARLAITAATGGAAAALMQARVQGASSAAALVTRRATPNPAARSMTSAPAGSSLAASSLAGNSLAEQSVRAMTDLGQISVRAQQHDPAALRAMQALNAAMAKPDAGFVALQRRASGGDPTAAQEMMIREDAIARAALGGTAP